MSVSTSTSTSPPPPLSAGQSPSSTTTSTLSASAAGNRHPSRPSFTIAFSQPAPLSVSSSRTSNPTVPVCPDPKSPTSASGTPIKRLLPSSSAVPNPATTSSSHPPHVVNQPRKHFIAPAHPQSHHLHTLPPREKTTRTLILDHTAWLHGRTRLAQGRCELGMNVRFKSDERATDDFGVATSSTGKRAGFYIGTAEGSVSGLKRASAFGDPPEVEIASSDEECEDGEDRESEGECVRALTYGRRLRQESEHRKNPDTKEQADRMEVELEDEPSSESDTDIQPFARSTPQDASVAPSLAARAAGIEKVLHAMLIQPPSSPPRSPSPPPYALHSSHSNSQHYRPPPSAQQSTSSSNADPARVLPNGLRLRLALLALVNDLFERQPPPSTDESLPTAVGDSSVKPSITSASKNPTSPSDHQRQASAQNPPVSPSALPPPSLPPPNTLPFGLARLAQISSQPFYAPPTLPSFHTLTLPSSSAGSSAMSTLSPISGTGYVLSTTASPSITHTSSSNKASVDGGQASNKQRRPPPPLYTWARPGGGPTSPSSPMPISPRSIVPHDKDSERLSASSPTSPSTVRMHGSLATSTRALPSSWQGSTPKHLPQSAKSAPPGSSFGLTRRARGRSRDLYSAGCYVSPASAASAYRNSFRSNVPTYGTGTAPVPAIGFPMNKLKTLCPRHLQQKCAICTSKVVAGGGPSTRIGAGLLKKKEVLFAPGAMRNVDPSGQSGSVLADLIPRFLRLSALVAMELGREARGEEPEASEGQEESKSDAPSSTSPISPITKMASHAQPTRAWFALLCGLLTRAVLEGYVARAWKGAEYVEVIMGVGLGIKGVGTRSTSMTATQDIATIDEENVREFEPDEMPGLIQATKVLFNGLVQDVSAPDNRDKATRSAEKEYVREMEERMSEFLTVPHASPDLATHLTQLSGKYPAEPVERAALRFCEAVAKWRGKPELEMYKKLPVRSSTKSQSTTPAPLSINALLASTPTPAPHRPPIDKYFRVRPLSYRSTPQPRRVLKRQRSVDQEEREPKKEKVEGMDIDLSKPENQDEAMQEVDSEWVGPYGV